MIPPPAACRGPSPPFPVFHAMENFFPDFPRHGKIWTTPNFSTPWKIFLRIFHAMENYFPHRGKYPFPGLNEAAVLLTKAGTTSCPPSAGLPRHGRGRGFLNCFILNSSFIIPCSLPTSDDTRATLAPHPRRTPPHHGQHRPLDPPPPKPSPPPSSPTSPTSASPPPSPTTTSTSSSTVPCAPSTRTTPPVPGPPPTCPASTSPSSTPTSGPARSPSSSGSSSPPPRPPPAPSPPKEKSSGPSTSAASAAKKPAGSKSPSSPAFAP